MCSASFTALLTPQEGRTLRRLQENAIKRVLACLAAHPRGTMSKDAPIDDLIEGFYNLICRQALSRSFRNGTELTS